MHFQESFNFQSFVKWISQSHPSTVSLPIYPPLKRGRRTIAQSHGSAAGMPSLFNCSNYTISRVFKPLLLLFISSNPTSHPSTSPLLTARPPFVNHIIPPASHLLPPINNSNPRFGQRSCSRRPLSRAYRWHFRNIRGTEKCHRSASVFTQLNSTHLTYPYQPLWLLLSSHNNIINR